MTNVMFRPLSQIQRPNHFKSFANPTVGQMPHQVKKSPTRTFTIPEDVNVDSISATFEQGILNITISKGEKAQPKKIEIL
ncbi:MAG: Hsp20/alpha crystallin family protein [Saprospiraceae bacterium]|nr:Hsp20/alpha crystallin family protein [Saprospiraceae bacterium]